jgi:type IV pilus assembly protein PilQ
MLRKKRSQIMYCKKNDKCERLLLKGLILIVIAATVLCNVQFSYASAGSTEAEVASIPEGGKIPVFNCEEDFGIRKALAMLGSMCQKNIVPSPGVDGQLAFRSLRDVTFEEAMDAILGEAFVYEAKGNLIKVYTKDEYKKIKENPDRMIYHVVTLYYISAEEAKKLIEPVLSENARIGTSTRAEQDISGGSGGGSGGSSSSGGGSGGSAGGSIDSAGGGDSMAHYDTIVVYDYPEKIAMIEDMLKHFDVRPKQVLVEATILSAVLHEDTDLGFDWNFLSGTAVTGFPANLTGTDGTPIEIHGFASLDDGLRIGISSDTLQGFISALETVTDVTVLANPKILALNKQEGSVLIGKNLGYRSSTTIGQGGVATEGEVKFFETGTQLVFRPYIGNDGYIRMEIFPKDSSAELDADGVPQETTTQLKTNILVKDGETIVLGGLFRDVTNTTRKQVPILGDLPLIGMAFRSTVDNVEREEVMIMLTPHIIDEPSQIDGQQRAEDISRKRSGSKKELQWYDKAKMAEDRYANAVSSYLNNDNVSAMKELKMALELRPSYLEAIRLKERIIAETNPEELKTLERIEMEKVDQEEAPNWQRY